MTSRALTVLVTLAMAAGPWPAAAQSETKSAEEILESLGRGGRRGFRVGPEKEAPPRITIPIHFETGSARISGSSRAQLAIVARALNDDALRRDRIRIEGHTDVAGPAAQNQLLSERRAGAVREYLSAELGVSPARLEARGCGEDRPIAGVSQETEEGRAQNRRVEFVNLGAAAAPATAPAPKKKPYVEVILWHAKDGTPKPLGRDHALASNDDYRVSFKPDQDVHLYVYQIDATGRMQALFPNADVPALTNPVSAGRTYVIPSQDRWFTLDATRGREQIIAVAGREKLDDPESLAWSLSNDAGGSARGPAGMRPDVTPPDTEELFTYQFSFQHQ